jgi:hypothetical protein
MRTIIAGSRDGCTKQHLLEALDACGFTPTVIISGTARGADKLGEDWGKAKGIPIERYPADWNQFGKSAGYRRNQHMASVADALIALWDGDSKGTKHMIEIAISKRLKVYVYRINQAAQRSS